MENYKAKELYQEVNEEIDLKPFLGIFKRNVLFISFSTITLSLCSVLYSFIIKPVYKGNFQIIIEKTSESSGLNQNFQRKFNLGDITNIGGFSSLKSQEFILKSPSVLMPVYKFAKDNDPKIKNSRNIDYKTWLEDFLKVEFNKGTNILSISFINEDRDFIIKTLDMISSRYKDYSRLTRERRLDNTIKYLSKQKEIYDIKSRSSRKKLNLFSIENGLGDIDGFVDLEKSISPDINNYPFNNEALLKIDRQNIQNLNGASQRFRNQFLLLEKYESEYTNLTSKLKPNSEYLIQLKIKIDNLRKSLKRPNEILLKLRELKSIADRDERLLNSIENNLANITLEKLKQPESWEMISKPTINKSRVKPKRKIILLKSFFLSIFGTFLLSALREFKSDKVFGFKSLSKKIDSKYLSNLYLNNEDISKKVIELIFNKIENKESLGVIFISNIINKNININSDFIIKLNKRIKIISELNNEVISSYSNILVIGEDLICTNADIKLLNSYSNIYKDKFIGWVYLTKINSI